MTEKNKTNIVRIDFCPTSAVTVVTMTPENVRIFGQFAKSIGYDMVGVGVAMHIIDNRETLAVGKTKRIMRKSR